MNDHVAGARPSPIFPCVGGQLMLAVAETVSITQVFETKRRVHSLCDPGINVADPQAVPFLGHTL